MQGDSFAPFGPVLTIFSEIFVLHRPRVWLHVVEDLLEAILDHVEGPKVIHGLQSAGEDDHDPGKEEAILPPLQRVVPRHEYK